MYLASFVAGLSAKIISVSLWSGHYLRVISPSHAFWERDCPQVTFMGPDWSMFFRFSKRHSFIVTPFLRLFLFYLIIYLDQKLYFLLSTYINWECDIQSVISFSEVQYICQMVKCLLLLTKKPVGWIIFNFWVIIETLNKITNLLLSCGNNVQNHISP